MCFAINTYFAHIDLITQKEITTAPGSKRLFQDILKRNKSGHGRQCLEAKKRFAQQKDALTIHNALTIHPSLQLNSDIWFWQKQKKHILRPVWEKVHCERISETVRIHLSQIFARFEIPKIRKTRDLKKLSESTGIEKMESTDYHPSANGLAERAVQTVNRSLQAWSPNLNVSFWAFL